MKNRQIRVDLAGSKQGDRDGEGRREGRQQDGGDDRTMGDWRRKPAGEWQDLIYYNVHCLSIQIYRLVESDQY